MIHHNQLSELVIKTNLHILINHHQLLTILCQTKNFQFLQNTIDGSPKTTSTNRIVRSTTTRSCILLLFSWSHTSVHGHTISPNESTNRSPKLSGRVFG
ncbi:hypothetical protein Hanom_Chr01g00020191 [Helianthus anomalus]